MMLRNFSFAETEVALIKVAKGSKPKFSFLEDVILTFLVGVGGVGGRRIEESD